MSLDFSGMERDGDTGSDNGVAVEAVHRSVRCGVVQTGSGAREGALPALRTPERVAGEGDARAEARMVVDMWPDDIPRRCDLCAFYIHVNPHAPAFGQCVRRAPVIHRDLHSPVSDLGRFPLMPVNGWCGDGKPSIRTPRP